MYPGAGLFRDATRSSVYFFRDDVFHCSVLHQRFQRMLISRSSTLAATVC
jgi:hypothetical protein